MMLFRDSFFNKLMVCGLIIFGFSCAQSQSADQSHRAKLLVEYYEKSSEGLKEYGRLFFEVFPNSFNEFNELYGYTDTANMPLTEYAVEHIAQFLFTLDGVVSKEDYMNKLISVAIGGKWYSDGVNYFQRGLREKIKLNLSYSVDKLSKLTKDEVKGFWYFYFDGPHPKESLPEELEQVQSLDGDVYTLMVEAHQQVLADRKGH